MVYWCWRLGMVPGEIGRKGLKMNFEDGKRAKEALEAAVDRASLALQQFPRGALGLTPDHIKATPKHRDARKAYADAAAKLRAFNAWFIPMYHIQLQAERQKRFSA